MEKKGKPKSRGNGQGTAILAKNKKSWIAIVTIGKKVVDDKFYTVRKKKSGFPTKKAALNYCPILLAEGHTKKHDILYKKSMICGSRTTNHELVPLLWTIINMPISILKAFIIFT